MRLMLRYERDSHGFRRAIADAPYEPAGWFLEQDVQGYAPSAAGLLATIDEVASSAMPGWEGTYNAHHLTLAPDLAVIENLWAEDVPPCRVGLSELRDAVAGWLSFVQSDAGGPEK